MPAKIDIGLIIKETVKAKNISVEEFAEQINCSQRNVYKIFNKSSIDTTMLLKISKVLDKNFFMYFLSGEELNNIVRLKYKEAELVNAVKDLADTVAYLKMLKKNLVKTKK